MYAIYKQTRKLYVLQYSLAYTVSTIEVPSLDLFMLATQISLVPLSRLPIVNSQFELHIYDSTSKINS